MKKWKTKGNTFRRRFFPRRKAFSDTGQKKKKGGMERRGGPFVALTLSGGCWHSRTRARPAGNDLIPWRNINQTQKKNNLRSLFEKTPASGKGKEKEERLLLDQELFPPNREERKTLGWRGLGEPTAQFYMIPTLQVVKPKRGG